VDVPGFGPVTVVEDLNTVSNIEAVAKNILPNGERSMKVVVDAKTGTRWYWEGGPCSPHHNTMATELFKITHPGEVPLTATWETIFVRLKGNNQDIYSGEIQIFPSTNSVKGYRGGGTELLRTMREKKNPVVLDKFDKAMGIIQSDLRNANILRNPSYDPCSPKVDFDINPPGDYHLKILD
jgi:hypothetical protein